MRDLNNQLAEEYLLVKYVSTFFYFYERFEPGAEEW